MWPFSKQSKFDQARERLAPMFKQSLLDTVRNCLVESIDHNRPTISSINCIIDNCYRLADHFDAEDKAKGIEIHKSYRVVYRQGKVFIQSNESKL